MARTWGLSGDVGWAILHHHDYAVLEDASTAPTVRALVGLSLVARSAKCRYQGQAESIEWTKGGALACAYLGMDAQESDELMDELLEVFHDEG